jgi:hypothetical protein
MATRSKTKQNKEMPPVMEYQGRQSILGSMLGLFEDALIRTAESNMSHVAFEPVLVIDMRLNTFRAFVLSLRNDGTLFRIARPIKIEEAAGIAAARENTPLIAYRKKNMSKWTACSRGRLEQLSRTDEYEIVEDGGTFVLQLPESDRDKTFERLWFAFLGLIGESDSGQDYTRVMFIVDNEGCVPLLQSALPRIAPRMNKGMGLQWQSAEIAAIGAGVDTTPFAFLQDPHELNKAERVYLLLTGPQTGIEYVYNGSEMTCVPLNGRVAFEKYDRIIVVGMDRPLGHGNHIQGVEDKAALEDLGLNGYVNWYLRIDDERLDAMRVRIEKYLSKLAVARQQTSDLQQTVERMRKTVSRLNQN